MKALSVPVLLLAAYVSLMIPFARYMDQKPIAEKLGYAPGTEVFKIFCGDQRLVIAEGLVFKVLIYFGSILEMSSDKELAVPPEYANIHRTLETAVELDPYNMDSYYFAQAVLVWDVHRFEEVNALLEYGMKYRKWDFMLPLFAGFNYAYFLKNYPKAAEFYRQAGELSGSELYMKLSGRYLYESNQTEQAISYLRAMEKGARNDAIRKSFQKRIGALEAVRAIEEAAAGFRVRYGRLPTKVEDLVASGFLQTVPQDPYGGRFYFAAGGKIRSTSNFYEGAEPASGGH